MDDIPHFACASAATGKRRWCEAALIAVASLVALASARDYAGGWNDGSRLATVESLVDRHTLAIDDSIFVRSAASADAPNPYAPGDELLRTKGTQDKLLINGHYYSDKSPLPAFWLAAWYALLRHLTGLTAHEHPRLFCYLMTVLSSGIAYVLCVWSVWRLALRHALPMATCALLAASLGLATVAPVYARQVNNHILLLAVVSLLVLALDQRGAMYPAIAGTLAGLGYTLDLGLGPVLMLCTAALVAYRQCDEFRPRFRFASLLTSGRWLGQIWPKHRWPSGTILPASDAPVVALPGHRRSHASFEGNVVRCGSAPATATQRPVLLNRILSMACFALAAAPWLAAHHTLNYVTGGTLGPANSVAAYLDWPGSPFSVRNMTGGWAHGDAGHFLLYSAALLFGKHGFLNYSLPTFLAIFSAAFLFRRRVKELPELVWAAAFCGGAWLLYAALSNNYSGPCCSIRWFVPFLAPAYYLLVLALGERRELSSGLRWLTGCGACLAAILWWRGPWDGSVCYLLWPLNVIALCLPFLQRRVPLSLRWTMPLPRIKQPRNAHGQK